jgi:hypothetical protein
MGKLKDIVIMLAAEFGGNVHDAVTSAKWDIVQRKAKNDSELARLVKQYEAGYHIGVAELEKLKKMVDDLD